MDTLTTDYNDPFFNEEFVKSLHHTGFAVIKNHPISSTLINKVYSTETENSKSMPTTIPNHNS